MSDLEVKYKRADQTSGDYACGDYVCFRHAVKLAMAGIDIEPEIDTYGGGHDCRSIWCRLCSQEKVRETAQDTRDCNRDYGHSGGQSGPDKKHFAKLRENWERNKT